MHTNAIYCGDCQRVLGNTVEFPDESVDLIYVDPPFFSNRHYEVLWGDGYELRAFEDRWKSGGIENYIAWMEPKARDWFRILKRSGSVYLHCDWHASHRLRTMMDALFGESNCRNEIIWQRHRSHNDPKQYGRVHDTILFYTKSSDYTWNPVFLPYDPDYAENAFRYKDPDGRRYQTQPLHASKPGGDVWYPWKGKYPPQGRYWAYSKENMEKLDKEGRIVYSRTGVPRYKIYSDESPGRPLQDLWTDIAPTHYSDDEKFGYPTQKPEALLERIIRASSDEGNVVLDPMCGCGTAIAEAQRLKRKWVGIDVSPTACKLMVKRMRALGVDIAAKDIIGLPKTLEEVHTMQPFEFQNWAIQMLMGRVSARKTGDMGIDGYLFDGTPVQIKQSEDIGRNVIDNFETAIRRAKKTKGMIVAFSFGKGAYEEVARVKNSEGIEITLKTTKELIEEE